MGDNLSKNRKATRLAFAGFILPLPRHRAGVTSKNKLRRTAIATSPRQAAGKGEDATLCGVPLFIGMWACFGGDVGAAY